MLEQASSISCPLLVMMSHKHTRYTHQIQLWTHNGLYCSLKCPQSYFKGCFPPTLWPLGSYWLTGCPASSPPLVDCQRCPSPSLNCAEIQEGHTSVSVSISNGTVAHTTYLLVCCMKCLERIFINEFPLFLVKEMFSNFQSIFRYSHNTTTNLFNATADISFSAMDSQIFPSYIFLNSLIMFIIYSLTSKDGYFVLVGVLVVWSQQCVGGNDRESFWKPGTLEDLLLESRISLAVREGCIGESMELMGEVREMIQNDFYLEALWPPSTLQIWLTIVLTLKIKLNYYKKY